MKSLFFVVLLFGSSFSYADERVFDCAATALQVSAELPSELELKNNPQVIFRSSQQRFILQVGNLVLNTLEVNGPSLKMTSSSSGNGVVEYNFWVDGSYEYQLAVSVIDHSAKLFWWGLGESVPVGTFSCEVIEQ